MEAKTFNPYKILEIPELSDEMAVIRRGFRRAALKYHPDKYRAASAREMFERV